MRPSSGLLLQAVRYAVQRHNVLEPLHKHVRAAAGWRNVFETSGAQVGASSSFPAQGTHSASAWPLVQQQQHLPAASRRFCSGQSSQGVSPDKLDLAATVIEQSNVLHLREELEALSEARTIIPFSEFARLASIAGCSRSEKEASELCAQLQRACIVLRHRDSVYLRPGEIAEAIMMMMPSNKEEAERKLLQLEAELESLDKIHSQLERAAQRRTNILLSMGLTVLLVQFAAFIYLTWWELSWDVMEPIGYIISLFYTICAYVYFLGTKGSEFDLGPFKEFWSKRIMSSKKAQLAFDQERWDFLVKQRDRIRKHLGVSHQVLRAVTKH